MDQVRVMQIYLPCGATRNYYFFGSTEHLPELVRVHKEHHLSFSVVQCAVPAFLAPLLAKGEEGHQSETLTFLLHSHSLPENREQCGDLEKKKRNCLYTQCHSAFPCVICCNLSLLVFAWRTVTPCNCTAWYPRGI